MVLPAFAGFAPAFRCRSPCSAGFALSGLASTTRSRCCWRVKGRFPDRRQPSISKPAPGCIATASGADVCCITYVDGAHPESEAATRSSQSAAHNCTARGQILASQGAPAHSTTEKTHRSCGTINPEIHATVYRTLEGCVWRRRRCRPLPDFARVAEVWATIASVIRTQRYQPCSHCRGANVPI